MTLSYTQLKESLFTRANMGSFTVIPFHPLPVGEQTTAFRRSVEAITRTSHEHCVFVDDDRHAFGNVSVKWAEPMEQRAWERSIPKHGTTPTVNTSLLELLKTNTSSDAHKSACDVAINLVHSLMLLDPERSMWSSEITDERCSFMLAVSFGSLYVRLKLDMPRVKLPAFALESDMDFEWYYTGLLGRDHRPTQQSQFMIKKDEQWECAMTLCSQAEVGTLEARLGIPVGDLVEVMGVGSCNLPVYVVKQLIDAFRDQNPGVEFTAVSITAPIQACPVVLHIVAQNPYRKTRHSLSFGNMDARSQRIISDNTGF